MRAHARATVSGAAVAVMAVGLLSAATVTAQGRPAGAVAGGHPAAAAAQRAVPWRACADRTGYPRRVQCARMSVPLDYDAPGGATLSLWMSRRPATSPADRIGTLFFNPGGPGASAADVVAFAGREFPATVRQRFDLVGIDPRGVGRSTPARCTGAGPVPFPGVQYPLTRREVKRQIAFDSYLRAACADNGNAVLDHMTTADTARDMDLVREALGESRLNYYGLSYGSYLGATYAALFPDRIRALAVDGVLDPVAWATGRGAQQARSVPFSTRVRSHVGAHEALVAAFTVCDRVGHRRCPLAGDAERTWRRMLHVLADGPVRIRGFGVLHYQDLVGVALGSLYDRQAIPYLVDGLEELSHPLLDGAGSADRVRAASTALRRALARRLVPGPYAGGTSLSDPVVDPTGTPTRHARAARVRFLPAFPGVACSDSLNPARERAWVAAADRAERTGAWFGRIWTWASGACARWPGDGSDAYRGPFESETSAPILAIGNTHDPATTYLGAVTVTDLFPRSRLLTLDDWGHTSFGASDCAAERLTHYLVRLRLPPAGTVCRPDAPLYPRRG
jgi:pimeloyl-ACP methyl ester carboxylesterase